MFHVSMTSCLGTQFKWKIFGRFCVSLLSVYSHGSRAPDGWGRAGEHEAPRRRPGLLPGPRGPDRPGRSTPENGLLAGMCSPHAASSVNRARSFASAVLAQLCHLGI